MTRFLKAHSSGQAMVEWAFLVPLFVMLFAAIFSMGLRFLQRQQLIMAVRQTAFMYSSGRFPEMEVKQAVRQTLLEGFPSMDVALNDIQARRLNTPQGRMFQLDECRVLYRPGRTRFFFTNEMEEVCVIKHAPTYYGLWMFKSGPPVPW